MSDSRNADFSFGLSRYLPIAFWTLSPFVAAVLAGVAVIAIARANWAVAIELVLLLVGWLWVARGLASNVWRLYLGPDRLKIRYYTGRSHAIAWVDVASVRISSVKPPGMIEIEVIERAGARVAFKVSRAYGDTDRLREEIEARADHRSGTRS